MAKKVYVGVQSYLESTGANTLNTGIDGKLKTKVEMKISINEVPTDEVRIFGANSDGALRMAIAITPDRYWKIIFPQGSSGTGSDTGSSSTYRWSVDTDYILEGYWASGNKHLKVTKVSTDTTQTPCSNSTAATDTGSYHKLYIFNAGNASGAVKMKVYYCKIYLGTDLLANLIPCGNGFIDTLTNTVITGSGTYNQGSSLPQPVKKIYVGVNGTSKRVLKGYVGDSNGVTRQFYPYTETLTFSSRSVIPTNWSTDITSASATNSWGTWVCETSDSPYTGATHNVDTRYSVGKAFDGYTDTFCWHKRSSVGTRTVYFYLDCPANTVIKPTRFTTNTMGQTTIDGIWGYTGSGYTTLVSSYSSSGSISKSVSTSSYFAKFRFGTHDTSTSGSSYNDLETYLLTITSGTIKKEYY